MAIGAVAPVDQRALEQYQTDFYEHADLIFRFGVILTGSRDGAERLTEETYRLLIAELSNLMSEKNPKNYLIMLAWRAWHKIQSERFHEWSHPTVNALRKLDLNERAALFAVDMAGILPATAATLLGQSEREIRVSLASARKRLASGEVSL